jgi:osmotically-inducible protein OsmY
VDKSDTALQAADLARRVEAALTTQALCEARRIHVSVEGSTVRLTGLVESGYERDAVEHTARRAAGVSAVVNELIVA